MFINFVLFQWSPSCSPEILPSSPAADGDILVKFNGFSLLSVAGNETPPTACGG